MIAGDILECCRCVMDQSDPALQLDANGHCQHCTDALRQMPISMHGGREGEQQMEASVEAIRRRNRRQDFDAVIGLSGGVDSSWAAVLAHRAGLRLLAVHCDTGWNSEAAVHNIHALVNQLGLDLETVVIDWEAMRDLQAAFFRASVPNCDIPQDHAIVAVNNRVAMRVGVKDFISGGNFASESILPYEWVYDARDLRHLRWIHGRHGTGRLNGYPRLNAFQSFFWLPVMRGVRSYRILDDAEYEWAVAKASLRKNFGWKDYGGKHHESRFTKFFQSYYLPEKFGYDKRRPHFSSLIVAGQMTRASALEKLAQPLYEGRELKRDRDYFLKKLRFTQQEWDDIMQTTPCRHTQLPRSRWGREFRRRWLSRLDAVGIRLPRNT